MKWILGLLVFAFVSQQVIAEQSAGEKTASEVRSLGRAAKKAAHRIQESVCTGSELECAAKKAKNRAVEAKDAVTDKAKELKDKVD